MSQRIGRQALRAAAATPINARLEPFHASDALAVTRDDIKEGWLQSLHRDPPASFAGG